jgi:hypothetical protein
MSTDPQRNPPQNEPLYEQVNRRREHQGEDRATHWPQSWDDQHRCEGVTNSRSRAFSGRNQNLKFRYGIKKVFETVSAFAAAKVRFPNEVFDLRLILISNLPLLPVDPVRTSLHRIW